MFLPQLLLRQSKKCMYTYTQAALFWQVQWICVHPNATACIPKHNVSVLQVLACTSSFRIGNLEIVGRTSVARDWTPSRSYQRPGGRHLSILRVLILRVTSILCEGTTLSCYSLLEKYGQHACSRDLNLPSLTQLLIVVSNSLKLRVVWVDLISGNKPGLRRWEE